MLAQRVGSEHIGMSGQWRFLGGGRGRLASSYSRTIHPIHILRICLQIPCMHSRLKVIAPADKVTLHTHGNID